MSLYLIAASKKAMERNEGTEVMASSLTEALDKYEAMGGACVPHYEGTGSTYTRLPDGSERETTIEWFYPIQLEEDELEPMGVLL